jgi:Phytanoyl-CoA dioxygenase (PhyH)
LNFPVGTQQPVHSDILHFSSVPDGYMCGVWVALEDVDADNGLLIYYPGSHTWPQFYNEHIGINVAQLPKRGSFEYHQKVWDGLIALYGAQPKRFFARKGQALIWLSRLLHGGDRQNDMMRTRLSQVTHYYFEGCCYWTPAHSDPFYGNIAFRKLVDIASGERVLNSLCGYRIPGWFASLATHGGPLCLLIWARRKLIDATAAEEAHPHSS